MKRGVIIALILFALFGGSIHAQVSRSKGEGIADGVLSRLVEFTKTFDAPASAAGAHALSDTNVPGGIVQINGCDYANSKTLASLHFHVT